MKIATVWTTVGIIVGTLGLSRDATAQRGHAEGPGPAMGFFVTSVGLGDGGKLGGLAGLFYCFAID
jgi:hypothetical protein